MIVTKIKEQIVFKKKNNPMKTVFLILIVCFYYKSTAADAPCGYYHSGKLLKGLW